MAGDLRSPILGILPALVLVLAPSLAGAAREAQEPSAAPAPSPPAERERMIEAIARLAPRYQQWIRSVAGLITRQELEFFLTFDEDYRRDAFMEAFWEPRDPDRQTSENELRKRWEEFQRSPGDLPYGDPRFVLYLLNGPPGGWNLPDGRPVGRCFSRSRELEIWFYEGSERTTRRFVVILQRRATGKPYEVYLPGDGLQAIPRTGGLPSQEIRQLCADELAVYATSEIRRLGNYDGLIREVLSPPLPSPEWLANFSASAAELPQGAETFEVDVTLAFPSRNQSRTTMQVMLAVPRAAAPGRRFDGELFHDFLLVGEVIRGGSLFESFRFRFEGPTPEAAAAIPLGLTRYLRPGPVTLRLLLEDVFAHRYAQVVREIEVPRPEGLPSVSPALVGIESPAATAPSLRLSVPAGDVQVGKVRFRARATGEVDKVTFYLDDKPVLSKRKPPYSVELDLGTAAEPHRVRVVGIAGDREVATDQIWLNQGAQRFRVHLVEPRAGGIYPGSLTARVEVSTPDGSPAQRLELYLNDEPVATLDQPPYTRTLRLAGEVAVVRAVAYLADGSATEDAVLVNASRFTETVEVQLVELSVLVTDAEGNAITGLARDQFQVFEDGAPQTPERFEGAREAPIHVALLVDRSVSMEPHLARVAEAARGFATAALRSPEDRIAVLSFADRLSADAGFTNTAAQVERALASLVAHGGTAFYDSLVQALNNFDGSTGQTALVVFSDGRDESSRLSFEQALERARRAGVAIYALGLEDAFPEKETRRLLERLAAETGGRAYFLAGLDELAGAYDAILAELGSRYLLAYTPSSQRPADEYRTVRVEVDVRGARVRTRRGYYP
ncbi:MAG: VWA domain-containing protein [bacterium]|nr:VWA domain-containing protein [bacterium]